MLSAVLSLAVSEEVISSNPVLGVSRERRTRARRQRARVGEQVKAMTRAERNTFLAVAAQRRPEIGPAFVLMALAGLRFGEVLGIRWAAVDFEKKRLCIHEQLEIDATKSGAERMVDLAGPLEALLRGLKAQRLKASMAAKKGGEIAAQRIVFPDLPVKADRKVQQAAEKRVRRAMAYCLKTAGLSSHFTPHSLRHTFCSLLIADSISPVYVQQQAGHASVDLNSPRLRIVVRRRGSGGYGPARGGVPGEPSGNKCGRNGNIWRPLPAASPSTYRDFRTRFDQPSVSWLIPYWSSFL